MAASLVLASFSPQACALIVSTGRTIHHYPLMRLPVTVCRVHYHSGIPPCGLPATERMSAPRDVAATTSAPRRVSSFAARIHIPGEGMNPQSTFSIGRNSPDQPPVLHACRFDHRDYLLLRHPQSPFDMFLTAGNHPCPSAVNQNYACSFLPLRADLVFTDLA